MVDTSAVINLSSKFQDTKANYKFYSKNYDNKANFKKYLSKEVKSNTLKSTSEIKVNDSKSNTIADIDRGNFEENQIFNKELVTKISEKLENLLNSKDFNDESLEDDLQEVINLLLSLIEVNVEEFQGSNSENIESGKSDILGELTNANFHHSASNNLFNEEGNINLEKTNVISDTKESLNNINSLLVEYLDNINTSKTSIDIAFDNIKSNLLEEVKNLLDILPEKVINEIENDFDNDISKEIFNKLILGTNKYTTSTEDNIKNSDINENILINDDTKIISEEADVNLNDNLNEDNSNESKTFNENSVNKEEEVLMKILDDDSNKVFSKTLNYYDKLNKINSNIEVVKTPVVINKDNINVDFIKNIRYMVKNSVEELNVKIYPKELGEMTIKLLSQEGIMKAEIKATSKETYNLLNSNLNEIKKILENQNIRIQEVNIGIYNEDTTFFNGRENSKESFENTKIDSINGISLDEEEIVEDLLNKGNVNLLA